MMILCFFKTVSSCREQNSRDPSRRSLLPRHLLGLRLNVLEPQFRGGHSFWAHGVGGPAYQKPKKAPRPTGKVIPCSEEAGLFLVRCYTAIVAMSYHPGLSWLIMMEEPSPWGILLLFAMR